MDLLEAFARAGVWGVVVVAVALILKPLYAQVLARDLKKFEQAGQLELERLRAELKIAGFERETRFAQLHERRAEMIVELYKRLVRAQGAIASFVHPLQQAGDKPLEEKGRLAADLGNAFSEYFNENRLYLDEPLCEVIGDLSKKMIETWYEFTAFRQDDYSDERMKAWIGAWKRMEDVIPAIRRGIEARLREILGVTEPGKGQ